MSRYGSEDSTSKRNSKLHDWFKSYDDSNAFLSMINYGFFGSGTSLRWIMGESAGEGLWHKRLLLVSCSVSVVVIQ